MMALDNQTPKKNTGRGWFNQNQNQKDPNAMDIRAMTMMTTGATLIGTLTEEILDENWCLLQIQKDWTPILQLPCEESGPTAATTNTEDVHSKGCSYEHQKYDH